MRSLEGLVGWGQLAWWGRFTPQRGILRLMTRGLVRSARWGSSSARISVMACRWAFSRLLGGKSRAGTGAAAGGAETS